MRRVLVIAAVLGVTFGVGVQPAAALTGCVGGTVTAAAGGAPLNGAMVRIAVGAASYTAYTNASGVYQQCNVAAGTYTVLFSPPSSASTLLGEYYPNFHRTSILQVIPTIAFDGSSNVTNINAALEVQSTISGTVTVPPGKSVDGVDVYVFNPDGTGAGGPIHVNGSGTSGTWTVPRLVPGSYTIWFAARTNYGLLDEFNHDVRDVRSSAPTHTVIASYGQALDVGTDALADCSAVDALFTDVGPGDTFCNPIDWLVGEGITNGYPDGGFHPTGSISRQSLAAFLYRYAGSPAFTPPSTPTFTDVPTTHGFYEEIEWLVDQGYASGYADGGFHPTAAVSRQAMVSVLWKMAGEPDFTAYWPLACVFPDVCADNVFVEAVRWGYRSGADGGASIISGYADGLFHPTDPVSRQAIAQFLRSFMVDQNLAGA